MQHDKKIWEQCENFLNGYLTGGYADIKLINKCKSYSEQRFCVDYLYNQKIKANLEPNEAIGGLEQFLNE